jgi:peptidoglycan/LPS O-acetylase OafA/YrhL
MLDKLRASRTRPPADHKNAEIEVLRAVAILFTLIQHLSPLLPFHGLRTILAVKPFFWGGVDLFFCISGYVITRSLDKSLSGATPQAFCQAVAAFWRRRFFRLAPSTWLWLLLSLVAALVFNRSRAFGPFWPDLVDSISAAINVDNWHIFQCVRGASVCGPNPIYWSLSLEAQFYLVLPALFLLPRKYLVTFLLVLAIVQFPLQRLPWQPTVTGALWFGRTDAISIGVLLALLKNSGYGEFFKPVLLSNRFLRLPIVFTIVTAMAVIPGSHAVSFEAGALAVLGGIIVFIASFEEGYLIQRGPVRSFLVWIGTRSFSLYLVHMPSWYFVTEVFFRFSPHPQVHAYPGFYSSPDWHVSIVVLFMMLVLAEANYQLVEVPLREMGRSARPHRSNQRSVEAPNPRLRPPTADRPRAAAGYSCPKRGRLID